MAASPAPSPARTQAMKRLIGFSLRQRWNLAAQQRKTGSTGAGDVDVTGHLDREGGGSVSWPYTFPDSWFRAGANKDRWSRGLCGLPGGLVSAPFAARLFPGPVTGHGGWRCFRFAADEWQSQWRNERQSRRDDWPGVDDGQSPTRVTNEAIHRLPPRRLGERVALREA